MWAWAWGVGIGMGVGVVGAEELVPAAGGVVSMSALKMKIATVNRIVMFQRYLKKIAVRQVFILFFT